MKSNAKLFVAAVTVALVGVAMPAKSDMTGNPYTSFLLNIARGEIAVAPDVESSNRDDLVLYYDVKAPQAWPEVQLALHGGDLTKGGDQSVRYHGGGGAKGPGDDLRKYCVSLSPQSGWHPMETKGGPVGFALVVAVNVTPSYTSWYATGNNSLPSPSSR